MDSEGQLVALLLQRASVLQHSCIQLGLHLRLRKGLPV